MAAQAGQQQPQPYIASQSGYQAPHVQQPGGSFTSQTYQGYQAPQQMSQSTSASVVQGSPPPSASSQQGGLQQQASSGARQANPFNSASAPVQTSSPSVSQGYRASPPLSAPVNGGQQDQRQPSLPPQQGTLAGQQLAGQQYYAQQLLAHQQRVQQQLQGRTQSSPPPVTAMASQQVPSHNRQASQPPQMQPDVLQQAATTPSSTFQPFQHQQREQSQPAPSHAGLPHQSARVSAVPDTISGEGNAATAASQQITELDNRQGSQPVAELPKQPMYGALHHL